MRTLYYVAFYGLFMCLFYYCQPACATHDSGLIFDTQDFAPFSYKADGMVAGPGADIIRIICNEMKIKFTIRLTSWVRAQHNVKEGYAQALFLLAKNPDRETWLYFSHPILDTEYGFFVRNDNTITITDISQISGYRIGVYGPSNTSNILNTIKEKVNDIVIDLRPYDEAGFRKLCHGRDDAVFSNRDVGFMLINKLDLKNIRYAGAYQPVRYYIAFSKKNVDKSIVDTFNSIYLKLFQTKIIQGILNKYNLKPVDLESK